jgi:hypothetical protein
MIKLLDLIEAKQVGVLYHFTNENGIISILTTNTLKSSGKYTNHISTTRDKNGWMVGPTTEQYFRITLDGNKLSNKYKIVPYQHLGINRGIGQTESEEAIITPIIPNIKDYILAIEYNETFEYELDINKIQKLYPSLKPTKMNRSSEWGDPLPPDSPLWGASEEYI